MGSPVEILIKGLVQIDRFGSVPIYLQISRQLIHAIQHGVLRGSVKLPGSRVMADWLHVHRKTVLAALTELESQGWVLVVANKGTFVNEATPALYDRPKKFDKDVNVGYPAVTGYKFKSNRILDRPVSLAKTTLEFTDGLPDVRLAPMDKLSKGYAGILRRGSSKSHLGYSLVEGNLFYREKLGKYLNDTRGLKVTSPNILTTRGIQMALYLVSTVLLEKGDNVVVGDLSYYVANMIFQQAGANISAVPVDEQGVSVEAVRKLCKTKKIRLLYLTPHHHYPTTVTLSTERRMELLNLSIEFGFVILEDDYDFDFHFQSSPLMPLASADRQGMVVYIGSFCKSLAPGLRAGYIVAPSELIAELAKLRRVVDRQGDLVMEQTLGEMLHEGEIQRHLKKAQKEYKIRRDLFCNRLEHDFSDLLQFSAPPGGLAVWTEWRKDINLLKVSKACLKKELHLPQTLLFQTGTISGVRFGFGNLNSMEINMAIDILKESVNNVSRCFF